PQLSPTPQRPPAARHTAALFAPAGHVALDPVHFSARSQTPAAPRHVTPAATKPSAGQVSLMPSQLSATSQMPAEARQTAMLLASFGHVVPDPLQVAATSHTPAAAPQTVPPAARASAGQLLLTPLQPAAT